MDEVIGYYQDLLNKNGYGKHTEHIQREFEEIKNANLQLELLKPIKYEVVFSENISSDSTAVFRNDGKIVISEIKKYSFIFSLKGGVNTENVNYCCKLAMDKITRQINKHI